MLCVWMAVRMYQVVLSPTGHLFERLLFKQVSTLSSPIFLSLRQGNGRLPISDLRQCRMPSEAMHRQRLYCNGVYSKSGMSLSH